MWAVVTSIFHIIIFYGSYYGVLMAYGGLQEVSQCVTNFCLLNFCFFLKWNLLFHVLKCELLQFLNERNPDYTSILVRNRVLPLYSLRSCSPYLLATANWVFGALASCLPQVFRCTCIP